jgi:hypothetical protein
MDMQGPSSPTMGNKTNRSGKQIDVNNASCDSGPNPQQETTTMKQTASMPDTATTLQTPPMQDKPSMEQTAPVQQTVAVPQTNAMPQTISLPQTADVGQAATKNQSTTLQQPRERAKRTWPPPSRRETVLPHLKRKGVFVDLTEVSDGQPPTKLRGIGMRRIDVIPNSRYDVAVRTLTPKLKEESPVTYLQRNLVGYSASSCGSPDGEHGRNLRETISDAKKTNATGTNQKKDESNVEQAFQRQQTSKTLPFADEGYGSFSASQENLHCDSNLTEEDLARKLVTSDDLRIKTYGPNFASSNSGDVNLSNRQGQNAAAWREKLERESVEKSRTLREATTLARQNGQIGRQDGNNSVDSSRKELPQYTKHEVGLLTMFGHIVPEKPSNACSQASNSSTRSRMSRTGTEATLVSETDDCEDDPFCDSQKSRTEIIDLDDEEHGSQAELRQLREFPGRTASSQRTQPSMIRRPNTSEPKTRRAIFGHVDQDEDLKAGLQRLKELTRFIQKQKAGPKTSFTPRHELDQFVDPHQDRSSPHPLPTAGKKFYSPFGEDARKQGTWTNEPNQEAKASDYELDLSLPSNGLQRAQNGTGGLAMLAQQAGQLNGSPVKQDGHEQDLSRVPTQLTSRATRVTAETFQVDFSARYTRKLSQQEKEVITRHEWLKERQRDFKALQQVYMETAKLACDVGVTEIMEAELETIKELETIVLTHGAHDRPKRKRVQKIKDSMIRRQSSDAAEDKVAELLGLIVDRKTMQQIEDELKKIDDDIEVIGRERLDQSNKRGARKPSTKPKKRVRLESAKGGDSVDLGGTACPARSARPKFGTEEYRKSQSDAYWNGQAKKEESLRERIEEYDNRTAESRAADSSLNNAGAAQPPEAREQDGESEVSEEDEGFDIYPGTDSASARPATEPASKANEISLKEINRLEEERVQQDVLAIPHPAVPTAVKAGASTQAPDHALAETMTRRHMGLPDEEVERALDAESETSEDSDASPEYVNKYYVHAMYQGVRELADHTEYSFGFCYKEENASALVRKAAWEFSAFRAREIADATEAEDEEWLARLGDPKAGSIKCDLGTGEQIIKYPASSCRIWIEKKLCVAKSKEDREVGRPFKYYVAFHDRKVTYPDGREETETGSAVDQVVCTCAALANREAMKIMLEWYGQHLEDGYLAMQRDALELECDRLGENGWWSLEESVVVEGARDEMRVWVEGRRSKGGSN